MKPSRRYPIHKSLVVFALSIFAVAAFAQWAAAQSDTWLVTRADYGYKNQRTDVTDLVQDLISRGGVNGRVAVNNQTMGGDPAVGKDKVLRVFARGRRGEEKEFDYNEGSTLDVTMFSVPRSDWDDRGRDFGRDDHDGYGGPRGGGDWNALWIVRGYYGIQGRTVNVTDILRSRIRDGQLVMNVNNTILAGDPAPGADKVLIVIYRYQGKEQATWVREGNTLSLP